MDAYQNYLNEIINSTYDEIKPLIDKLYEVGRCPSCNGHFLDNHCKYCGYEVPALKNIIDSIEYKLDRFTDRISNLPIKRMPINKLFNLLYTFKEIELTKIKDLFEKYQYDTLMIDKLKEVILKISNNEELTEEDIIVVENQIVKNNINLNLEPLFCYFMHEAILRKPKISYVCFKHLIKNYAELKMKPYYRNPSCIIQSTSDMTIKQKERQTVGQASYNKIWLSEEEVKAMYYEGGTALLNSMFHEIAHTMQYKQAFCGFNLNIYIIKEIKEHILTQMLEGYYEENYDYISYELEAEYYGITNAIQFLKDNGFVVDTKRHEKELKELETRMSEEKRYYKGVETSVDILFDEIIYKRPELLDKHPQLKYLYIIEGSRVYQKSEEDLIDDYNMYIDNPTTSQDDKEFYKKFYGYFLGIGGRK